MTSPRGDDSAEAAYRPPVETPSPAKEALSKGEQRRAAYVLGASLLATSILGGLVMARDFGDALHYFEMDGWLAWIAVVGIFRQHGATVAAIAAVVTIATLQHDRRKAGQTAPRTRDYWPVLVAVPPAALVSACLMTALVIAVASAHYGVPAATSWRGIVEHFRWTDIPVGTATAGLLACAIALVVRLSKRLSARLSPTTRGALFLRIIAGLLFLTAAMGTIDFMITLLWTGTTDTKPLIDRLRDDGYRE